jgi:hypothetical protein
MGMGLRPTEGDENRVDFGPGCSAQQTSHNEHRKIFERAQPKGAAKAIE